jgi:hypothetical protein
MNVTLYQLAADFREAASKLGDLDLPDDVVADTLEGMSGELETKATNVAAFARDLEATAASIKEAEAQMKARREAIERRAARLRHYLLHNMQVAGIKQIECPWFKLSVRDNPPAVEVFDQAQVPEHYMKTALSAEITDAFEVVPEDHMGIDWLTVSGPREAFNLTSSANKAAIKAAIQAGEEIAGCKLTRGHRLEIR